METSLIYVLFGVFFLLLLLGAPITVSLGVAALATYLWLGENPMAFVQIAFTSVGSFPLMALPAFILAGALMEAAGISRRLVDIAEAFAGPVTGGLAAATVFACMFFGAISGSGPATTAAVGMLMIPAMANRGYDRGYGSAITASSGGLGVVIPPSIPMVIFGISGMGAAAPGRGRGAAWRLPESVDSEAVHRRYRARHGHCRLPVDHQLCDLQTPWLFGAQ